MSHSSPDDRPALSLWDAASLIVGIVIGSSIFRFPPAIFSNVSTPAAGLAVWLVGGLLSFAGAMVYAELATTYPRLGGEYNYLSRAFGDWLGFLYAWAQLSVIQTGSIGATAYVAAESAAALFGTPESSVAWIAAVAVIALTLTNMAGLRLGAGIQNVLTVTKLVGLAVIVVAGLVAGRADPWTVSQPVQGPGLSLALVFVLYAYGGWSDAAFVAAEVRNLKRNVPRALLGGLGAIVLIYLLVNYAYLRALGGDGLRETRSPPADVLSLWLGPQGAVAMHLLVLVSALGGVNGLIFAVSRVHATAGQDHRLFHWLGRFSRGEAPVASLAIQAAVTVGIILTLGTPAGRDGIDALLRLTHFPAIPWSNYNAGLETLVAGSAPAFWLFFLLNAAAFFVLRWKDPHIERPFVTPGYPVVPALFAAMCAWMLYSAADYAWPLIPVMSAPLLLGVPLYAISDWADRKSPHA